MASIVGALLLLACETPSASPPADLVLTGGKIWTADSRQPEAEAVAIWQDKILAIGPDEQIKAHIGPDTRVVRLEGRRVVPGFGDSHVHLLSGGLQLRSVDLKDARDEAEFGARLREFARKLPPGRWLLGGNWDHDRTFGGKLPTAAMLDRYVPDRPCLLRRYDGHMALVNSRTLQLANIGEAAPDPAGGQIMRDPRTRQPTGLLRDTAMSLVDDLIPPLNDEELAAAVGAALDHARRMGVTSLDDMAGLAAGERRRLFRCYQRLATEQQLTARIHLRWPLEAWRELAELGLRAKFGGPWLTIGGLKGFCDGSLGSSTAKMWQPYLNEPQSTGVFVTSPPRLAELVTAADNAGLAVAVHAIGDHANSAALHAFAAAAETNGPRDRRFRIEHAQHVRPDDFERFRTGEVIASMQPYHVIDDGRWAEGRIGRERCATSYAFRSFLDHGVRLAFGSDWPVAPLDPLLGIDAAVNRRTLDGRHPEGWYAQQRISVTEALQAYTLGSAYALRREHELGSLMPGKLADLVALSRDIFDEAERDRIAETTVVLTIVGGRVVFEAAE
ncbi:MAG TPA: amidohydrolase [Pirellulales bacterium]|nr:amidohydrolase [Pirellulales bacterium]